MSKIQYHIVQFHKETTVEDFTKALSLLNELNGVIVNQPNDEKNTAYIYYDNVQFQAKLYLSTVKNLDTSEFFKLPEERIIVECEKTDDLTVSILRRFLGILEVRIYNTELKCLLPYDESVIDCTTYTSENHEKATVIMRKFNLEPAFLFPGTYTYYSISKEDNSVRLVNDNLLYHFVLTESDPPLNDEFSYKVAENIGDFVHKFDRQLIPTNFYEYYKKSFKIINFSGFDINNPGRKVFIKPYILEFNSIKNDFFKIAWDQSALLFMDKIRKDETLNDSILRIIRNELKISSDYVGATVARTVEFDLDRNNNLTPRLILRVYVADASLTPEQSAQKDRTWISLDQISK